MIFRSLFFLFCAFCLTLCGIRISSANAQSATPAKPAPRPTAKTAALGYQPRAGDTYTFEIVIDNQSKQIVGTQQVNAFTQTLLPCSVKILASTGTGFTAALLDDALTVKIRGLASAGMPDTTLVLRETAGMRHDCFFAPNGKLLHREAATPDTLSDAVRQFLIAANISIQNTLELLFPQFPPTLSNTTPSNKRTTKQASEQLEWSYTLADTVRLTLGTLATQKDLRVRYQTTLDTLGTRCHRLAMQSTSLTTTMAVKPQRVGSTTQTGLRGGGNGSLTGTLYVEATTGIMVAASVRTELSTTLRMQEQPPRGNAANTAVPAVIIQQTVQSMVRRTGYSRAAK